MRPYYSHAGITIYHGDCREVLPTLGYVDLVLTDPPYGVQYVTSRRSRTDKLRVPIAGDGSIDVLREVWPLAISKLMQDRHWYMFASPRMLPEAMDIAGTTKHVLAWDKGDRGTVGDLECGFGEAWEAILYGMIGRRALNGPRPRTVLRNDWSSTMDPVHPTVKPVQLLAKLIYMSSTQGETVLDPFMGSGTTLRAAKDLRRNAIGIEIEERYCEIAANRLAQEVLFPDEVSTEAVVQSGLFSELMGTAMRDADDWVESELEREA
jgi:site-specific DNA-methyltransferase (adenine-specific)